MQKLLGKIRCAVDKYNMILPDDSVAIGVSGGKDSLALLVSLVKLREFYPKPFSITAITVDPCFNAQFMNTAKIEQLCKDLNVSYYCKRTQLGEVIFSQRQEKNPCSLCARMRRGILHNTAKECGCTRIALGHHFDDAVETFFMNLFQCGKIGCFSPVTHLSRKELHLIRPMIFCEEKEVRRVALKYDLPVEKSACPIDGKTERQHTKELIKSLEKKYPSLRQKVIGALQRANIDNW